MVSKKREKSGVWFITLPMIAFNSKFERRRKKRNFPLWFCFLLSIQCIYGIYNEYYNVYIVSNGSRIFGSRCQTQASKKSHSLNCDWRQKYFIHCCFYSLWFWCVCVSLSRDLWLCASLIITYKSCLIIFGYSVSFFIYLNLYLCALFIPALFMDICFYLGCYQFHLTL